MDEPVHGLSAGGLQSASCQKQAEGEGVRHGHLPSVRLVNLSANQIVLLLTVFVELFGLP